MGFDRECIIDIHTYPGEYFCPVCHTLVYPNEALQSQCSHLYCKPCLAHIANGIKACPYDGFLVTESDSKTLLVSDGTLAEKIGKVKVRCLYFNSGCTWEGTLSDSTRHCSECAFGSSAVICTRCGVEIVHREVYDHVQSCKGGYGAKQAVPFQGQSQLHASNKPQVNPQKQPPHVMCPQGQIPSQIPERPLHSQLQFHPQARPPPPNQPTVPAVQMQHPHPPASGVTGHQTYQHSGSLHPVKLHDQFPRQPALMPPPPPSAFSLPRRQISGAHPAQFSTHAQPSNHLSQHSVVLQPVQQAVLQQVSQQQPFVSSVKAQFQPHDHFQQQQPLQPQLPPPKTALLEILEDDYFSKKYGNPVARVPREKLGEVSESATEKKSGAIEAITRDPQGLGISLHPVQSCAFPVPIFRTERGPSYFGSSYGTQSKLNPGLDPNSRLLPPYHPSGGQGHPDVFGPGPESGQHHAKHFLPLCADREYLGISHEFGGPSRFPRGTAAVGDNNAREAHRFGEGSSSFNIPSDPMPGHPRRDDSDNQHHLGFGEHMIRPSHSHINSDDSFGKDGRWPVPVRMMNFTGPGHLHGHFISEAAGPSGHSHAGELAGPGNSNHQIPSSTPPLGEPGIRGSYPPQPHQGFPNHGTVGSFDQSRNRKPNSMGWCRICLFDYETVEGLEMHSQTKEHQKLAMDLVTTMKQRNRENQITSAGSMGYDVGSSSKKRGY